MTEAFVKFLENLSHNDKLHVAKSPPQILRPGEPPKTVIMLVVLDQAGNAVPNTDTACFVLGADGEGESLAPVAPEPDHGEGCTCPIHNVLTDEVQG